MADGDHDTAIVVADGAPFGESTIGCVLPGSPNVPGAGDLEAFVEVVHDVKYLITVLQIFDGTVWENKNHPPHERVSLVISVRIVDHDEAADYQVLAHSGAL